MTDCLFCKIVSGEIPAKIIYEDDYCLAFRDINPQAPTHVLIIPRQHIATINDIEPENTQLLGHLVLVAKEIARGENLSEGGYRLIMNCNADAGQTVFHIHVHLLGGRIFGWPPG
jgi:histidine triad (HIT) family protein